MRILVNGRFRKAERITGVQRYAEEITRRLPATVGVLTPPGSGRIAGHAWEQFILPGQARGALLWSPANSGPALMDRQVITLHDLAVIEHPEWFRGDFAAWAGALIPRLARRARRILTVSSASRNRIIEILHIPQEKIEVVYPGVGAEFQRAGPQQIAAARRKYGLRDTYFVCVGSLEPRKNLSGLLAAWRGVSSLHPEIDLALFGAPGGVFRAAAPDVRPGVVVGGYADDNDLPALYSGALALVMPSLYEGFGLPALEAAACGTPVVISPAMGTAEVLEDACKYADPLDPDDIAASMLTLIDDEDRCADLGRLSAVRAGSFPWERSAAGVAAVLAAEAEKPSA